MKKEELLSYLNKLPESSSFFSLMMKVSQILSENSDVKIGYSDYEKETSKIAHLLPIYTRRLALQNKSGKVVCGLEETVNSFKERSGSVLPVYIDTKEYIIYLWFTKDMELCGGIFHEN